MNFINNILNSLLTSDLVWQLTEMLKREFGFLNTLRAIRFVIRETNFIVDNVIVQFLADGNMNAAEIEVTAILLGDMLNRAAEILLT